MPFIKTKAGLLVPKCSLSLLLHIVLAAWSFTLNSCNLSEICFKIFVVSDSDLLWIHKYRLTRFVKAMKRMSLEICMLDLDTEFELYFAYPGKLLYNFITFLPKLQSS